MALVRMPNCPGFSQPITADDVTKVFKETNDIIQQCSYNKMSINLNQLEVSLPLVAGAGTFSLRSGAGAHRDVLPACPQVVPVTLPCTPAVRSAMLTCDDMALRSMALQAMGNPRVRRSSVLPTCGS